MKAEFSPELVRRYNVSGARYTSYPTANMFVGIGAEHYLHELQRVPDHKPLSLYLHVPFCATICYYCACNKINTGNQKHADPYVDRLVQEMAIVAAQLQGAHPVEQLHFGGGTPTFLDDQQFRRVFAGLNRHFALTDRPARDYSIEIDPRAMPTSRVELLASLGFNRMSIGIQDFDPAVQAAVNRIQSEQETADVVSAARANGFGSINVDLIYGLPRQTEAGFQRTIERVLALDPDRIALYNYAHLPQMFKTQRQIRDADLPDPQTKLQLLGDAIELFSKAGYEYVGMDHFAKPTDGLLKARQEGTLHRNFQGYTTHGNCELVALGVSAISKVGRAYAQNAKTLNEYYAAIDQASLATNRGFLLRDEDVMVADVIQRLMCDFELDIEAFQTRFDLDFWQYFQRSWPDLSRMAQEGLIDLSEQMIRVTPRGRFLIRNVCMLFDQHLPGQPVGFSKTV